MRKPLAKIFCTAVLLACGTAFAFAAKPKPAACKAAQDAFQDKCSMCHGPDGKGYDAIHTPDFTDPKWQAAHTDAELASAIRGGVKAAGIMPAFKDQLTAKQIDALVSCVVRAFGRAASPPAK